MDINALMTSLLSADSVNGLSRKTGASRKDVEGVLAQALPMLLSGANEQAVDTATSAGFAGALSQHAADDISNLTAFLDRVDLDDGDKIISHLFGQQTGNKTEAVSQRAGVNTQTTGKILAMVAPLLMSLLGKQAKEEQHKDENVAVSSLMSSLLGKTDISSLALSLLGGGAGSKPSGKDDAGINLGGVAGILGKLFK